MTETKTRAQQRIAQLINIGRPLTDPESDELYRALHADYMRQWRAEKRRREVLEMSEEAKGRLLTKLRREARPKLGPMRFSLIANSGSYGVLLSETEKPRLAQFISFEGAIAAMKAAR